MSIFLAVDLGTTGCRSILFNDGLEPLGSAYEEYGLITTKENYVEQDAELWWQLTLKTAKAAIAAAGIDGKEIRSISISSQGITIVPVDHRFRPLCNAISWLDNRCTEEIEQIKEFYSAEEMTAHTGKPLLPCYTLPKILWLQKHRSAVLSSAYKLLMPLDFLTARFTGKAVTDHSMACGTLFYDVNRQQWWHEILERFQINPALLPELAWSGSAVGKVLPSVAEELGLSPDCVVSLGAQDQKCAALAAGLAEDTVTVSLGTAGAISQLHPEGTAVQQGKCSYLSKGSWVTEGVISAAGTCLRYVRDLLYKNESYALIDQEAAEAMDKSQKLYFFPYLSGPSDPYYYPASTGSFYNINLATERGDYALAVMEGIAYQIRSILESMNAYQEIKNIVVFGGAAKSDLWCRIIADITNVTIAVPSTAEAAGAGAAMLAAKGTGLELAPLQPAKTYAPSADAERYSSHYERYRTIEKKLFEETK